MARVLLFILLGAIALEVACTSSNPATPINQGSRNYDSEYREQTRGTQTQAEQDLANRVDGDPAITIMLMGMETGDVYPGEDYFVYAVVDNPDNRDLEYVWSVASGSLAEVPEAERGRLASLVETELLTASPTPADGDVGVEGVPGELPPGGETLPPGTAPGQATPGIQAPPAGSGLPGTKPVEQANVQQAGTNTGSVQDNQSQIQSSGGSSNPPAQQAELPLPGDVEQIQAPMPQLEWETELKSLQDNLATAPDKDKPDIQHKIDLHMALPHASLVSRYMLGAVIERRLVSGEEDLDSENVEALAAQLAASVTASRPQASDSRAEPEGDTNVVEESAGGSSSAWIGNEGEKLAPGRDTGIRSQYQVWKDESEEPRRRWLGGYGSLEESEPLLVEESYEQFTFTTEEPFLQWTPEIPGPVNIHMKVYYKDDQLTEPRTLAVTVRLRDPMIELSEEFPDILREDEAFYVALTATNIPAFYKGLFTLTFDPNMLSFREAELGEFFDDATGATIFYAEPDKMQGKVLLAIDSNREMMELGGEGVLAYVMFKAKQDITSRDDTMLAIVLDTSARYILDFNGENVLPLPVAQTAFRTDTIMPPILPEIERDLEPGSQAAGETGQPAPQIAPGTQPQQQPAKASPPVQQQSGTGAVNPNPVVKNNVPNTSGGTNVTNPSGQDQNSNAPVDAAASVSTVDEEAEDGTSKETETAKSTDEDPAENAEAGDGTEGDTNVGPEPEIDPEGEAEAGSEPEPEPEPSGEGAGS